MTTEADADGWVLDVAREEARKRGAIYIEMSYGQSSGFWASQCINGGPWMKRKQSTFYCERCQSLMPAGPDFSTYCAHNQPERPSELVLACAQVKRAEAELATTRRRVEALTCVGDEKR